MLWVGNVWVFRVRRALMIDRATRHMRSFGHTLTRLCPCYQKTIGVPLARTIINFPHLPFSVRFCQPLVTVGSRSSCTTLQPHHCGRKKYRRSKIVVSRSSFPIAERAVCPRCSCHPHAELVDLARKRIAVKISAFTRLPTTDEMSEK